MPMGSTRIPGRHGASIFLVRGTISSSERGLFIAVNETDERGSDCDRVHEQYRSTEDQGLADDGCEYSEVHGIADIAIQPADNQPLGRDSGGWGAETLADEPHECVDQHSGADRDHDDASRPYRDRITGAGLP